MANTTDAAEFRNDRQALLPPGLIVLRQDEGAPLVLGVEFDPVDVQSESGGLR